MEQNMLTLGRYLFVLVQSCLVSELNMLSYIFFCVCCLCQSAGGDCLLTTKQQGGSRTRWQPNCWHWILNLPTYLTSPTCLAAGIQYECCYSLSAYTKKVFGLHILEHLQACTLHTNCNSHDTSSAKTASCMMVCHQTGNYMGINSFGENFWPLWFDFLSYKNKVT